jgi:MFS family permease
MGGQTTRGFAPVLGDDGVGGRTLASDNYGEDDDDDATYRTKSPPERGSWKHRLFGFMYEEEMEEDLLEVEMYNSPVSQPLLAWLYSPSHRQLHMSLFASLILFAAANAVPVTVLPSLQRDFASSSSSSPSSSSLSTQFASAAVLGTSIGKLVNGPIVDMYGARRTSSLYSLGLSVALFVLACSPNSGAAKAACFFVEFCSAVQWPSALVALATHHRGNASGAYEGGIYLCSLAVRFGALWGMLAGTVLLRPLHWRAVAMLGSWAALMGVAVTFLYVEDSPLSKDEPQNPVDPNLVRKWFPDFYYSSSGGSRQTASTTTGWSSMSAGMMARLGMFVFHSNVVPSLRHIGKSPVFWIVAVAHTGCAMVRTSDRILATYLLDTSPWTDATQSTYLSTDRASMLSACLSAGTGIGLIVAGTLFATRHDRERTRLVSRLYLLTIASCYALALLAVPAVRNLLRSDPNLITVLQTIVIAAAGFGISVPLYHIPGLVGASFGCDKGMFSAYVDGVAYGLASMVWHVVGNAVQRTDRDGFDRGASADGAGGGWAYGWAAVALLLIPCAILMVEFMEHYFCRHRYGGTLETILIA